MTVTNTTARWVYNGDGASTAFVYDNRIFAATDLQVYVAGSLKTITVDYSVTGVGATGGGTVVFVAPPAVGTKNVLIVRAVPATQTAEWPENQRFPSRQQEDAVDKLTMLVQQNQADAQRTVRLAPTSAYTGSLNLPDPAPRRALVWNEAGDALTTSAADPDALNPAAAEGVTYLPAGAGAVTRTAQSKLRDFVTPEDFGALGDGTTDDTAAIAAADATGLAVYFSGKVYRMSSVIKTAANAWYGAGKDATTLRKVGTSADPMVTIGTSGVVTIAPAIKGIGFEAVDESFKTGPGVYLRNCGQYCLDDVYFLGFTRAIQNRASQQGVVSNFRANGNSIFAWLRQEEPGDPYTARPNRCAFVNGQVTGCDTRAVDFNDGAQLIWRNCQIDLSGPAGGSSAGGIEIGANACSEAGSTNNTSIEMENAWFEAIEGSYLNVNAGGVVILGGISASTPYPMRLNTTKAISIIGFQDVSTGSQCLINASNTQVLIIGCGWNLGVKALDGASSVSDYAIIANNVGSSLIDGWNLQRFSFGLFTGTGTRNSSYEIDATTGPVRAVGRLGVGRQVSEPVSESLTGHVSYVANLIDGNKDSTKVGCEDTSGAVVLGVAGGTNWFGTYSGFAGPLVDNTISGGSASRRYTQFYAETDMIGTSDARDKTPPRPTTPAELAVAKKLSKLVGIYQWLDAIEAKGEEAARLHIGPTAQSVRDAFEAEGLDGFRYGMLCYDAWEATPEYRHPETGELLAPAQAAGNRYSIRSAQLLMWMLVGFEARLAQLEVG